MNYTPHVLAGLQSAANTILAVLAPQSARLVRAVVAIDDRADTASTDGQLVIVLPPQFCGCAIPADDAVSVGLLVHEAGHFVQPIKEVVNVEQTHHVPHWLANVVLDIHGEAFAESVFPALQGSLRATRRAVQGTHVAGYHSQLQEAADFRAAAAPAALISRFSQPDAPFTRESLRWSDLRRPWFDHLSGYLAMLADAALLPAANLPNHLVALLDRYPELQGTEAPPLPGYGRTQANAFGSVALDEAREGGDGFSPGGQGRLLEATFSSEPPETEAARLARTIRTRFQAGRGSIEVAAPGRLQRLELARGAPVPFRMTLPGRERPAPQLVLCIDISGSMGGRKLAQARVAGQAIALAVQEAGGHVAGVLFSDDGIASVHGDAAPLFAPLREWQPQGGTSFAFLAHVWRRWPAHQVLLLTDGYGATPVVLPGDRARTSAVLIYGDATRIAALASRVVSLTSLSELAAVLALLTPRTAVA